MSTWLETMRGNAREAFIAQGLPTRAHEAWKTTPTRRLSRFTTERITKPTHDEAVLAAERVAALAAGVIGWSW